MLCFLTIGFLLALQAVFAQAIDVEKCNGTAINYKLLIGIDARLEVEGIEDLKNHFQREFLAYLRSEYPDNVLDFGTNFDIFYCVDNLPEVPSEIQNINFRILKDGLGESQSAFYDTILLEMISINQLKYRRENTFVYKIRELWNKSVEPESYSLPIWIIIILVFSSTIAFAVFLLIVRQVFECSVEDTKLAKAYVTGIGNRGFVIDDNGNQSMTNQMIPSSNDGTMSRKPSLIIPGKNPKTIENNQRSAGNSIHQKYINRKDIKGLDENYENIRVESTNLNEYELSELSANKTEN